MTTRKRPQSDSPVPSITLQITQKSADLFLRVSEALTADLKGIQEKELKSDDVASSGAPPLSVLDQWHEAMHNSNDESVLSFVRRLKVASLLLNEEKVAALLFQNMDVNDKLALSFQVLTEKDAKPTKHNFVSLFQSILTGITCCCEAEKSQIVVEGKPDRAEGLSPKRVRIEDATVSTKPSSEESPNKDDLRNCQSPSFDSSLATLNDEDQGEGVRKEISEVANYAADQLLSFFDGIPADDISVERFSEWYEKSGSGLVPWMELLSVSKWKSASSGPSPTPETSPAEAEEKEPDSVGDKENEVAMEQPRVPTEPSASALSAATNGHRNTAPAVNDLPDKNYGAVPSTLANTNHDSPGSLVNEDSTTSRTLVSFDFSGSGHPSALCINISEDNLYALRHFVHRTGLMHRTAAEICKRLLRFATRRVFGDEALLTMQRDVWIQSIDRLLGKEAWEQLSTSEKAAFTVCLTDIFACYEGSKSFLRSDEVDLQEFSVGFCFFCAGNKSTKLSTGFEVLDDQRKSSLSQEELLRYLNSYLTMLVAMSLLKPISHRNTPVIMSEEKRRTLRQAVESGSRWTLGHFVKHLGEHDIEARKDSYSFEKFASWYSSGGYEVAPWLELLDLSKVFSLLGSSGMPSEPYHPNQAQLQNRGDRVSSLRRHHSTRRGPPPEVLFTFPLAAQSSLVVLKDDANYVRGVVEQLGLLSMNPDDLWASLSMTVERKRKSHAGAGGAVYVNMSTFVDAMQAVCPLNRARSSVFRTDVSTVELLSNFFQCFDLENNDHVALDELMGGLTLLCGGKKSHKLAFAFGVFDTRPGIQEKKRKESITHSLSGEDLFLFLRSILIVTFSCCRQSLDMTDGMVGRCIADTANMICNDVMRHQWERRHKDRLNFDEFGQWYNDGGFERSPWLELLDLKKWVLVDDLENDTKQQAVINRSHSHRSTDRSIPPPPPEDSLDADFFESGIMPMDSMDEMDMILMQPSNDKDTDISSPRIKGSFSFSSVQHSPERAPSHHHHRPLTFHLNTEEEHGGYVLSLSHKRIRHLREILQNTSLHKMESEAICNRVIAKASKSKNPRLTKEAFDLAISSVLQHADTGRVDQTMFDMLSGIFTSFDRERSGKIGAHDVACGFTVLCNGKKSDKLEYAFEILDKRKRGHLSKTDLTSYLKSFLTVLLSIAFSPALESDPRSDSLTTMKGRVCENTVTTLTRAADAGANWAAKMAFNSVIHDRGHEEESVITFDQFAEWYTSSGYSSIPWLELLDLRKWVFADA